MYHRVYRTCARVLPSQKVLRGSCHRQLAWALNCFESAQNSSFMPARNLYRDTEAPPPPHRAHMCSNSHTALLLDPQLGPDLGVFWLPSAQLLHPQGHQPSLRELPINMCVSLGVVLLTISHGLELSRWAV